MKQLSCSDVYGKNDGNLPLFSARLGFLKMNFSDSTSNFRLRALHFTEPV